MASMIGNKAPDFHVQGVSPQGEIQSYSLSDFADKHVVLFFYPMDFTFVCPLELLEMSKLAAEFEKNNAVVLGVSVDSEHTHAAWRNTPVKDGGIGALAFPLLADIDRQMTQAYGVQNIKPQVSLRATVIIDPNGIVRIHQVNDLPIGRNPDEILRLVQAIDFHAQHGDQVCPPKWTAGQSRLQPNKESLIAYQAESVA